MKNITRYFIQAGVNFLDLSLASSADATLDGQTVVVRGSSSTDMVYVGDGISFDFTSSLGGNDLIFVKGRRSDFTPSLAGVNLRLTRTDGTHQPLTLHRDDTVVFEDGSIRTNALIDALNSPDQLAPALDTGLNSTGTASEVAARALNGQTPTSRIVAFGAGTESTTYGMVQAGMRLTIKGTPYADVVYVKPGSVVDFRNSLLGEDKIYLTGTWSDYTKVQIGNGLRLQRGEEQVDVGLGDRLIFADGSVPIATVFTLLRTHANPTVQDLQSQWQANVQSPPVIIRAGALSLLDWTDSGRSAVDGISNDTAFELQLSGQDVGLTVSFQQSTDGGSHWLDLPSASLSQLADGAYRFRAKLVGPTGNMAFSTPYPQSGDLVIDASAPERPALSLANDRQASDGISNDGTVQVSGLESGASWQYRIDGGDWADGQGSNFSLAQGRYAAGSIEVRQVDVAGNSTVHALDGELQIDQTAPVFSSGETARSIEENTPGGERVYTAQATDRLLMQEGTVRYSLKAGVGDVSRFGIDAGTGEVTLTDALDFEAKSTYGFTVVATDRAGNTSEQVVSLVVTDVNEAPTAVSLEDAVTRLPENSDTSDRIQVATLRVTDDATGQNDVTLVGADADHFEVDGDVLYLRAGTPLNFETKASYAVTVSVQDSSIEGSSPVSTPFSLTLTDVNDAPTGVGLSNTVTSLPENSDTRTRIRVATISVSDDATGSNTLSLSGLDAWFFEIAGGELYLKAGTSLDFESKPSYEVTVLAADSGVVGSSPASTDFNLIVTDVNEAPTSVWLEGVPGGLPEDTPTNLPFLVATIMVNDDALGRNTYSLSGADASLFEILGNGVYIKTGTALDYETKRSYDLNIHAVDSNLVGSSPVGSSWRLSVTDVNEAPTAVTITPTRTSLSDSSSTSNPILVATIAITDDALGTNTVSLSGEDEAKFEVVGKSLYLRQGATLDHNTRANLTVTVNVQDIDLSSTTLTANYNLAVSAGNRPPSEVTLSDRVNDLAEGSSTDPRVRVGVIYVSDDGQGTNMLSLGGTDAQYFEIDSGALYLKAGTVLNYEDKAFYEVTVSAQDSDVAGVAPVSTNIRLQVTDVNEAPTAVSLGSASLPENIDTGNRFSVAPITVTDDALGSNTLSLSGRDANLFEIEGGVLYLKAATLVDYETQNRYELTIRAQDSGVAGSSAVSTDVILTVTDVNEAPTALTLINTVTSLEENADLMVRARVATIEVTDDALGTHVLSLGGADAQSFEIDGDALYLKAGTVLDHERQRDYSVNVLVSDNELSGGSPLLSTAFNLRVTDVNEAPTGVTISPTRTSMPENASGGRRILVATLEIADDALGTNTVLLSGQDASVFEVIGNGLYVKQGASLDHTTRPTVSVTLSVQDDALSGSSSPLTATYSLTVDPSNAAPTGIALSNPVTELAEDSSTGSRLKVADIVVTDDGQGGYTLSLSGTDANFFEIVGDELFLKASTSLHFETKASYAVTVSAQDHSIDGSNPVSTSYSLTVTDVNYAPSGVVLSNTVTSLPENSPTHTRIRVATISVNDDPSGSNTLSLSGPDAEFFEIADGELYLTADTTLDFESKSVYEVTVGAQDFTIEGSSPVSTDFSLSVTNVDDNGPVFSSSDTATAIAENTATGAEVYTAVATDSDYVEEASVTYSLKDGAGDGSRFSINDSTGVVTLHESPDYDTKPSYTFTVVATDGAGNTSEQAVTLAVTNLDDNGPVFSSSGTATAIAENTATGAAVYTAVATDSDYVEEASVTYSLKDGAGDGSRFSINGSTGVVTLNESPDYETKPSYTFTVVATDGAGNTSEQVVTLAVTNVDE